VAWNPSPEVAVARDAAKKFGDADECIILWIKGENIGMATYGRTKELCADAKRLGDFAWTAIFIGEHP